MFATLMTVTSTSKVKEVKRVTRRTRGYMGWRAYYGVCEVWGAFVELDKRLAWNTSKSAHGPWWLSRSPALNYGLSKSFFTGLGLPQLADC